MTNTKKNLGSLLYDVGFMIIGDPDSKDREAVYVPTDGSVTYDTLNDYFRKQISEKRNVSEDLIYLITTMRAQDVIS